MKKGDKYLIEIGEVHTHYDDHGQSFKLGRVKGFSTLTFDERGLSKLTPYEEEIKRLNKAFDLAIDRVFSLESTIDTMIYGEEEDDPNDFCEDGFNGGYADLLYRKKRYKNKLLDRAKEYLHEVVDKDDDEIFSEQTQNILGEHRE